MHGFQRRDIMTIVPQPRAKEDWLEGHASRSDVGLKPSILGIQRYSITSCEALATVLSSAPALQEQHVARCLCRLPHRLRNLPTGRVSCNAPQTVTQTRQCDPPTGGRGSMHEMDRPRHAPQRSAMIGLT